MAGGWWYKGLFLTYLRSEEKWAFNWHSTEDLKLVSCPRGRHSSPPRPKCELLWWKLSQWPVFILLVSYPKLASTPKTRSYLSSHTQSIWELKESQRSHLRGYTQLTSGIYVKIYTADDGVHVGTILKSSAFQTSFQSYPHSQTIPFKNWMSSVRGGESLWRNVRFSFK